jgi:hypothetical protein
MRRAVNEAAWHVVHRRAFGSLLVDQPLMQNVVADLAVAAEAATALAIRLAAAVDGVADPQEAAFRRIALPLAKFWVCKRTPALVAEALECLGGNGYVEESGLPLLYREAPLNAVWEGSGNVNALDVLRALSREPEVLDAWITEVGRARGGDPRLDRAVDQTLALLGDAAASEGSARRLAGRMAACLQGSLLVRHARRRSPTCSAPAGSGRGTMARTAPSPPPARTCARWWTAPPRPSPDPTKAHSCTSEVALVHVDRCGSAPSRVRECAFAGAGVRLRGCGSATSWVR